MVVVVTGLFFKLSFKNSIVSLLNCLHGFDSSMS